MPRLNILTDKEQLEFDFPPALTVEARAICFAIDSRLGNQINRLRGETNKMLNMMVSCSDPPESVQFSLKPTLCLGFMGVWNLNWNKEAYYLTFFGYFMSCHLSLIDVVAILS